MSALYQDDGIAYLAKRPDEILTELALPAADGWDSIYLKLRRRGSFDFPVLGVAVAVRREGEVVREARVVLGAVASTPREAAAASTALVGQRLTSESITRAAEAAAGPAKPLDNTDFTHPYRKRLVRVYVARALARLAGLDAGPSSFDGFEGRPGFPGEPRALAGGVRGGSSPPRLNNQGAISGPPPSK